jgi:hypothetical protein
MHAVIATFLFLAALTMLLYGLGCFPELSLPREKSGDQQAAAGQSMRRAEDGVLVRGAQQLLSSGRDNSTVVSGPTPPSR